MGPTAGQKEITVSIRGSIDSLTTERANGWVFSPSDKGPIIVQALLFGRIIGEAIADEHRPDLAAAGIGDGHSGFGIVFYEPVDPALLPMVSVRPIGGDVELPRTDLTGFPDFFRAMQARFPAAGRSRSVFGGLWTDRTDAARVLAGRIASGATPPDLEETLRRLINDGYVVLRNALAAGGLSVGDAALIDALPAEQPLDGAADAATRRVLEGLPGVLFRPMPLALFRAVLDDTPVAYRAMVHRGPAGAFSQPSNGDPLPSPAECLLSVVASRPEGAQIDVVRGSHALPEFTADGRSRWVSRDAATAIEIGIANGASVDTVEIGPNDMAVIGPGTIHRARGVGASAAVSAWCTPSRQVPLRTLARDGGTVQVRHSSGAGLIV